MVAPEKNLDKFDTLAEIMVFSYNDSGVCINENPLYRAFSSTFKEF